MVMKPMIGILANNASPNLSMLNLLLVNRNDNKSGEKNYFSVYFCAKKLINLEPYLLISLSISEI
jgi:hypothetical protein